MKKFISGVAIATLSLSAFADDRIEEVFITASPHGKTTDQIAGAVNVLSGAELQKSAAATLGETIKGQLGVTSSSFGPGVGTPVIRGLSGSRVAKLQNGLTIGDVSSSSLDHAVAAEALLAERVEILRGPSTLRYGGGAIGGVVNVIDHRIHTGEFVGIDGAVEARFNDNNNEKVLVGRFDAGTENLNLHLDGVTRDSDDVEIPGLANHEADDADETTDGYIANSDREADAFSVGLTWVGEDFLAGFSVSSLENQYGLPPGGHGHHDDHGAGAGAGAAPEEEEEVAVRIDLEQTVYQAKLQWTNLSDVWDKATIDLAVSDYEHDELEIHEGEVEVGTTFDTDTTELRIEAIHGELGGWLGAVGLQSSQRDFIAVGEEAFVPPSETSLLGVFVTESKTFDSGTLELGIRLDEQTVETADLSDITHDSVNLSASWLQELSDTQRFSVVLTRSERAPTAEELLSDGEHVATNAYELGDANLDNETAVGIELNWVYEADVTAKVSIYHNDFSNYLYLQDTGLLFSHDLEDTGFEGLDACAEATNPAAFHDAEEAEEAVGCFTWLEQEATFTGIEAEVIVPIADAFSLRFWGDLVRAELGDGSDVPFIAPARVGVDYNYESGPWNAEVSVVHVSDQDRPGLNQEETDGYVQVDFYGAYTTDDWSVFAKLNNLTDEEIRNATSFTRELAPEPGFGVEVGARYFF